MEIMMYFENEYCSLECFGTGEEFMEYLEENESTIKDFEILEVSL